MHNEKAVKAFKPVRQTIQSFNLPFMKQRKFNGLFNAIEMQVEEGDYSRAAVDRLCEALIELARFYKLESAPVEQAVKEFQAVLKR